MTTNTFLLSWDCQGIEAVINVTAYEKETVWAKLQDKPGPNLSTTVGHLMLRARANPQRHYEIYTITVTDGINEQDLREMFEANPQSSAELVRERGNKIFSDRFNLTDAVIK